MSLAALHKATQDAQQQAEQAAAEFHRAVAQAMRDGRSAVQIAHDLGVSRGRVYQWRRKGE